MMRTIRVTGRGQLKLRPDVTRIAISLDGLHREYGDALRRSTESTEAIKDLIVPFGFERSDLKTLSFSVDSANVGRGRGGVQKALALIKASSTVVAIDSDCIFPPSSMRPIADAIPGASYHVIRSKFGHDGFLLETQQLTDILSPLLQQ